MEVNWKEKWMSFDYQGGKALLQGILPQVLNYLEMTSQGLSVLERTDQLWCLIELYYVDVSKSMFTKPPEVQQLIDQFSSLFQPPSGLPPKRSSVHTIPLVPGAQPFRMSPYRYNSS